MTRFLRREFNTRAISKIFLFWSIIISCLLIANVLLNLRFYSNVPAKFPLAHVSSAIPAMISFFVLLVAIFLIPIRSVALTTAFLLMSFSSIGSCIFSFAYAYTGLGLVGPDGKTVVLDLPSTLYFSIITWTTVGYGDIRPTEDARGFAALEAITGAVFMSLFISGLVSCLSKKPD